MSEDGGQGGYAKLTEFKKDFPHLKVSLAIGGWEEGPLKFSELAADPQKCDAFVENAVKFLQSHGFDGLDLDWEYPTLGGGKPEDRKNFTQLVMKLKAAFKEHGMILTSAIGGSQQIIDEAYDIDVLSQHLDYFHVMCFNYHKASDKTIGPNAPLLTNDSMNLNVTTTIAYLIEKGAPAEKIVLGLPFFGRTFIEHRGGVTSETGFLGPFTQQDGYLGYNEICRELKDGSWDTTFDIKEAQAYATQDVPDTCDQKVIVYDNTRSIAIKVKEGIEMGLGGFMVWTLDTDDFLGQSDPDPDTYADYEDTENLKSFEHVRAANNFPLLRTITEAVMVASEMHESMNCSRKCPE